MNETDLRHLRTSIGLARRARERGNHPFGAILADAAGNVLVEAENTVLTGRDVTGHAETNLVRALGGRFGSDALATATMYASTEPCAMCAGAIHWAGIGRLVYALSEVGLYDIAGPSAEHLLLPCRDVFARSGRLMAVEGPVDLAEAREVHAGFWR